MVSHLVFSLKKPPWGQKGRSLSAMSGFDTGASPEDETIQLALRIPSEYDPPDTSYSSNQMKIELEPVPQLPRNRGS